MLQSKQVRSDTRHASQGAVSVIAVLLLVALVIGLLLMTARMSNFGISDTLNQSDSVAAFYLAESGLEYASAQLFSGAASGCDASLAAVQVLGAGRFSIDAGMGTDYDGVTPLPANQCRIQVTGSINNSSVQRVIQSIVQFNPGGGGSGGSVMGMGLGGGCGGGMSMGGGCAGGGAGGAVTPLSWREIVQ